jgi:hypothetical protein
MTKSPVYRKFIKNVYASMIIYSYNFQNICFKYFTDETLEKNICTPDEIEEMKNYNLYRPYETDKDTFKNIKKTNYNFCELTIIISCIYDINILFLDVFNIMTLAIKN